MKLLANENFPSKSIQYLKDRGFDIRSIGTDSPSVKDNEVMGMAMNEDRLILTFDRDYGELIFKHNYKPTRGVIYLRLDKYRPEEFGKMIEELLAKNQYDFDNALTVISGNGIRQRKYQ